MKVAMIGAGYVGLVTGACFAEFGYDVCIVDNNKDKIDKLLQGIMPIYEPGLASLVEHGIKAKRLSFETQMGPWLGDIDVVMIAVGTPSKVDEDQADLSYVFHAVDDMAPFLKPYTVIATKSTVPVGTGDQIAARIAKLRPDLIDDVDVVSNPEFLREGSAIQDFMRPDRVVVGAPTEKAKAVMNQLYRPLYLIETPLLFTNRPTAEIIKYASNGFLALKIAFMNQMADLCEKAHADVQELAKGVGLDNRIGRKFLNASPGYGGSCFPKDTKALWQTSQDYGVPATIMNAVIQSNDQRKYAMATKIMTALQDTNTDKEKQKTVCILGITFKPNTDDIREAPSLVIIPELLKNNINVVIYDPIYYQGSDHLNHLLAQDFTWPHHVTFKPSALNAIQQADAIVILTEWNEFRGLDLKALRALFAHTPLLIDLRNIYKLHEVEGYHYISLGRPPVTGDMAKEPFVKPHLVKTA